MYTTIQGTAIPTNLFTHLEPQDQEIGEFHAVQECQATYFKTQKL